MSTTPAARETLQALLVDFERTLAQEYEALRTRNVEALETAVTHKRELTLAISETGSQCDLSALGTDNTDNLDGPDLAYWTEIRALVERCAVANRTNGAAVKTGRTFTNALLDLISGRPAGESLYDARGRVGQGGRPPRTWESA